MEEGGFMRRKAIQGAPGLAVVAACTLAVNHSEPFGHDPDTGAEDLIATHWAALRVI